MTQIVVRDFKGLYVQGNSFSVVPDGALEKAENVVITYDGRLRKVRGFSTLSALLTTPTALTSYRDTLWCCYNSKIASVNISSGALTDLSGAVTITSGKPRFAQAGGNLYIATSAGVKKIESTTSSVLGAGIPSGLDVTISLSTNAGILAPNAMVGYRILFGRTDANKNKVVGAPSELSTKGNPYIGTAATAAKQSGTSVRVTGVTHGLSVNDVIIVASSVGSSVTDGTRTVSAVGSSTQFDFTTTSDPVGISSLSFGVYKKPTLNITLPAELTTENFYQVYRTSQTSTSTSQPSDDGQLVYEANLSSTDVSNGYLNYVDTVDEVFRVGGYLYTNPSQEGILSANGRPPFATDLTLFRDTMLYANVQFPYTLDLNLISVASTLFAAGDYVVITGNSTHRYVATTSLAASDGGTAASTPNTSSTWDYGGVDANGYAYFYLSNATTSISVPIATTAKSLCKAINRRSASEIYAKYVSGASDVPGKMYFETKNLTPTISVTASSTTVGGNFQPTLPTSGTSVSATNDAEENAVYVSKLGEYEAVPRVNRFAVGPRTSAILRAITLRDSVIFVTEAGIYRLTGDSAANFQVTLLDSTVICVAADTVGVLNNAVLLLSTQGVVAVTESGASIVSRQIEPLLTAVTGQSYIAAQSNAVAYESEHLYLLSTVAPNSETADTVYIYNLVTSSWTTSTKTFADAIVHSYDDRIYQINLSDKIEKERKDQTKLDYTGVSEAGTAGTVVSTTVSELSFASLTPEVDDVVVKSGSDVMLRITTVDLTYSPPRYTFSDAINFIASDVVTLYKPIISTVKTAPLTAGDITQMKQFWQFNVHFRDFSCSELGLQFFTEDWGGTDTTTWTSVAQQTGWGYGWGTSPWGGTTIDASYTTGQAQPCVTLIPVEASRASFIQAQLIHNRAGESMDLQAYGYSARAYGKKVSK
jgi:hypothetical protein